MDFNDSVLGVVLLGAVDKTVEGCVLVVVTVLVVDLVLACALQEKPRPRASVFDWSNQWATASVKIDQPQLCEWVSGLRFCMLPYQFSSIP